jgi:ubiquinol-cytochrome c reductase cytochrome b subunit
MATATPTKQKSGQDQAEPGKIMKLGAVGGDWLDQRVSGAGLVKFFGRKIFPDHWSFMFGEVILYSFIILVLSGIFLTLFFVPSMDEVTYDGVYEPLQGATMSKAYESTLKLSFEIRGGLFFRQMHHWAALVFMVGIFFHMFRVFFTGAFRKPRELNWVVGFFLLLLGMIEGFTGYSLPDDVLSGNGLRVMDGLMKGVPLIGPYLTMFLFGGEFPGVHIIPRLFTVHILLLPALILALVGAHLIMMVYQKHTQYPGPGRTERNVVGAPIWPNFAFKMGGFFLMVFGVIALISSTTAINAIWVYGPYDPSPVSAGSQPDWYMLWTDGGLRLIPGWEFTIFGYVISLNILLPILFYGGMIVFLLFYPWIESWVTGDKRDHHLLDFPYNTPVRTGLGVAWISIFLMLCIAASNDLIAVALKLSINDITWFLRIGIFVIPVLVFWITKRLCISMQRQRRDLVLHGSETSRVVRMENGEMLEIHEPLNEFDRWTLVQHDQHRPLKAGKGVSSLRAAATSFFFKDQIDPVTPADLRAAQEHAAHEKHRIDEVTGGDYRIPAERH